MVKNINSKLREGINGSVVDFENDEGYKQSLLREQKIPNLAEEMKKSLGEFKIEIIEFEGFYTDSILLEKDISEVLFHKIDEKWVEVLSHTIYSYERELDHFKEYIFKNAPLIRFLYIDIEEDIYYLEDVDGGLYCSINKIQWFKYLVPPKDRPYFKRENKLYKIKIPTQK